jgi:hypothetical protein
MEVACGSPTQNLVAWTIGRGKRRVTICAELGTPNEFLNITVDVPGMGTEVEVCERRAKVFARQFAELSAEVFPCSDDAPQTILGSGLSPFAML